MRIFFAVFRKIIIFARWYSAFCWICSRTLRGCVDWNIKSSNRILNHLLSHPTWVRGLKHRIRREQIIDITSHPTWVRGLKLTCLKLFVILNSRTLRGCVDWNNSSFDLVISPLGRTLRGCVDWNLCCQWSCNYYQSHPTWVRGLKHILCVTKSLNIRRTLRGCVDWNILLRDIR